MDANIVRCTVTEFYVPNFQFPETLCTKEPCHGQMRLEPRNKQIPRAGQMQFQSENKLVSTTLNDGPKEAYYTTEQSSEPEARLTISLHMSLMFCEMTDQVNKDLHFSGLPLLPGCLKVSAGWQRHWWSSAKWVLLFLEL